ncbi:MAG: leucyl/phenylalanyl-tRNA--protein transferase [Magnetococcales bacterium]|nr:leucyl/phenylalanyl-tRNA--protein transferase [Magnetococcales bacterium]
MPVYRLPEEPFFPDPALAEPNGLLAVGGDLSPSRLLSAYALGIFPWFGEGDPLLWWSLDPRLVIRPEWFHLPRSLAKTLRQGRFVFTFDCAFAQVMEGCAVTPRGGEGGDGEGEGHGTWITDSMKEAYQGLHELGHAHSVEAWSEGPDGAPLLAGGMYGVALGGCFFGESMFYRQPDASKAALATLMARLAHEGFLLLDCQQVTAHMQRFGGRALPRRRFQRLLDQALEIPIPHGRWR